MSNATYDVIVVGGGFAGLSASYYLKQRGLNHLVFERGRVGEAWRSLRWDSFRLNSTNKLNVLPGMICEAENPDGFEPAASFVSSLEKYIAVQQLPVQENSKVISVDKPGDFFQVSVSSNGLIKNYSCRQVLIASGCANEIKIPSLAENISKDIMQLHTGQYRNADQLPAGAVLVVGSAQSGVQITEDLLDAGRKVYLSTSEVGRIPRHYRGLDIFYWVISLKFYDIKAEELQDPELLEQRPPQITGTGTGKDSLSLQSLAKKGAAILGKLDAADGYKVTFQPNAAAHVKYADAFSEKIKKMIDGFIIKNNLTAPPPRYDEADIPDHDAACASNITSVDLQEKNIRSIIWCTGFHADYSYIKLPVFDNHGKLKHKNGIPDFPGIHFLGYPWLFSRKSPILFGIYDEVELVVDNIYKHTDIKDPSAGVMV